MNSEHRSKFYQQNHSEELKILLYTKKLWYEHFTSAFWLQNNLCEFTTENTHSKGDFVLKNRFEKFVLVYKINLSQKYILTSSI